MPLIRSWLFYFTLYNLLFFSLQLGFILSKGGNFVQTIPLPLPVYIELATTLLAHLGLYLLLSLWQTLLLWGLSQHQSKGETIERWQIMIWSLGVCALLSSNGYFFPLSEFSRLFFFNSPPVLLLSLMAVSVSILGVLTLNALMMASKYKGFRRVFLSLSMILFIANLLPLTVKQKTPITLPLRPNIIFIGIDSLSPANISMQSTPNISQFTKNSVLFEETISPLAHTYPAWTSILTGLYPHHHGARYNLMPPHLVQSTASLAWTLQERGYQLSLFETWAF